MIDLNKITCFQSYKFALPYDYMHVGNGTRDTSDDAQFIIPEKLIYDALINKQKVPDITKIINLDDFNYKGNVEFKLNKYDILPFMKIYLSWLYNHKLEIANLDADDRINSYKRIIFNYNYDDYKSINMDIVVSNDYYSAENKMQLYTESFIHHEINKILQNFLNEIDDKNYYNMTQPTDHIELSTTISNRNRDTLKIELLKENLSTEEISLFVNYCTNNLLSKILDNFGGKL